MPLTEYDFSLFEPASSAAPVRDPVRPHPKTKPRREPVRKVREPRGESLQSKNARARKVWKRTFATYAIVSVVGVCMFAVVQTEAARHQAYNEQQKLYQRLSVAQQQNASYRTQIDRKYSLEIIQGVALGEYRMVPVEGGRVTYLNIARGDQVLK